MAQQDKTDWYWNGVLAGAVNNLYYDFINVDVVHVPYTTTHRNSSFFLQTRRSYIPSSKWEEHPTVTHKKRDVVDVKYIWRDSCSKEKGEVYTLLADKSRNKIRLHKALIEDGCVQEFDWNRDSSNIYDASGCGAFKLFSLDYVMGKRLLPSDVLLTTSTDPNYKFKADEGIQINKYEGGTTHGYFTDLNVSENNERFKMPGEDEEHPERGIAIGSYILVYKSRGSKNDGFAGQVRMITGMEGKKITVDAPWQGFKVLEGEGDEVQGGGLSYAIFPDWGEVIGFTQGRNIYIVNYVDNTTFERTQVYEQEGLARTDIISVTEANDKVYVLTDNGYIHYSNYSGYDKFFIQDDVYAGDDKTAITTYRDILIAFGDRCIAAGVPDENNTYTTIYNQSNTVGLWSRYAFAEYDGDLIFVSNDKRLLALGIASNSGKYMLQYEDVGDMINSKLSILLPGDEVYVGSDNNDLRVFWQTKSMPFYNDDGSYKARLTENSYEDGYGKLKNRESKYKHNNTMTRIIKFDKQFKVWTEDWVQGILLQGVDGGIYYGENGLYQRGVGGSDYKGDGWSDDPDIEEGKGIGHEYSFKTYISAYLIENESDWVGGTSSWLANRAKLYNVAKLNRLITTLGPGIYSHGSEIRITSYVKGLGSVYKFSIDGGNNDWLGLITTKYMGEEFDERDKKKIECMTSVLKDNQQAYQPKCVGIPNAAIQNLAQQQPWCGNYDELLTFNKGVCIDDSLYELAPTMPLATNLGEVQSYATQIKLELIGGVGDVISFGGRLGEMFVAPLFTTGPDGEYQLQPNTDC